MLRPPPSQAHSSRILRRFAATPASTSPQGWHRQKARPTRVHRMGLGGTSALGREPLASGSALDPFHTRSSITRARRFERRRCRWESCRECHSEGMSTGPARRACLLSSVLLETGECGASPRHSAIARVAQPAEARRRERRQCRCESGREHHFRGAEATEDRHRAFTPARSACNSLRLHHAFGG